MYVNRMFKNINGVIGKNIKINSKTINAIILLYLSNGNQLITLDF